MEKTCFVIMGFHQKTDPLTGRTLDLDKSYRGIIKPAAQAAGYTCIRADEIQHSGLIDVPMYGHLMDAELVIADLSTLNPNAFYELGVRYALRPRKTIVIAEEQFKNPFDTNHIAIRRYRHDGLSLDFEVVDAFRAELTQLIKDVDAAEKDDSPVLFFLDHQGNEESSLASSEPAEDTYSHMVDQALALRAEGKFSEMATLLDAVRVSRGGQVEEFILQQLALARYKSKEPDALSALETARDILKTLNPETTFDAETIGLWGAVHKRLAQIDTLSEEDRSKALDKAIKAHRRAFALQNDHYNGINAALLLDLRASRREKDDPEAIADRVQARRFRRQVLEITDDLLSKRIVADNVRARDEKSYWISATRVEALYGLGRKEEADEAFEALRDMDGVEDWMLQSTEDQLDKLAKLL